MRRENEKYLDDTFNVLSNKYRRKILDTLFEHEDEALTYDQIVERLEDVETDKKTKHLEFHLYHVHLPKMRDAGLIEYDEELETVRLEENRMKEDIKNVLKTVDC